MNKEEIIIKLGNELLSGIDFAQTQTPILCQQIAKYGIVSNTVEIILSVVCIVSCMLFLRWQIKNNLFNDDTFHWSYIVDVILSVIFLVSTMALVAAINPLIKATFSPYVYVIDYLK